MIKKIIIIDWNTIIVIKNKIKSKILFWFLNLNKRLFSIFKL